MAKTASPLKIKKFLAPTPGGPQGDPVKTLNFAINRMGFAVADIGQLMVDDLAAAQGSLINAENDRKRQLELDRKAEEQYEQDLDKKDIEDGAKKGIKKAPKKIGWVEALLKPLKWLAKAFLGWSVLTFLQQPGKRNDLRIGLAVIGGWFKTLYKVTTGSIGLILDGLGTKSPLMAVLKIVSGIGGLFLATRILRPWKLIGDYKKLEKFYKAFKYRKPGSKFAEGRRIVRQRQLNKQLRARKLLRMKRLAKVRSGRFLQRGGKFLRGGGSKFMKVGGKFLKGGGMSVLAGAFSFGNRLASGKSMQNAVGGGAGAVIGGLALSALLTPILGPFGPIVGQFVGSFLGDKIGAFLGDAITPLFKPIQRAFGMYFQIFKKFFSGVTQAFADLWNEGLAPLFVKLEEIFKPLIDAGIQRINEIINSPWAEEAMYNLVRLVNSGKRLVNSTANLLNLGDDQDKIDRRVENQSLTVADSLAKIKMLEKIQEEEGEDYRGPWWAKWRFSVSERIEKEKQYLAQLQAKEQTLIAEQTAQKNETQTAELAAKFPLKDGFLDRDAEPIKDRTGLKNGMVIRPRNPESFPIDVFAIKAGKIRQYDYHKKGYLKAGMIIEGDGENPDINYRNVEPTVAHKTRVKPGDKIGELIDARKHRSLNPLLGMMDSSSTFLVAQAYRNHKIKPRGKYNKNILPLDKQYPTIFPPAEQAEILSNTVNPKEINSGNGTINVNDLKNDKEYIVNNGGTGVTIVQPINQPVVVTGGEVLVSHNQNEATVY
mgnify:CR=1 FL=1